MTAEEQLVQLSQNAAKEVERYLVKQQKDLGWFTQSEADEVDPAIADADKDIATSG